jgi:hypothetical protein
MPSAPGGLKFRSRHLLSDDMHHRRRDGLCHQLERSIDLLKLIVLLGERLIKPVIGLLLTRTHSLLLPRRLGDSIFALSPPGYLCGNDRTAACQEYPQHDSRDQRCH